MLLGEIIRVALQSIRANFFRALLTMLGIIIGVAAVITMVALGAGAQRAIDAQIEALGANILTVSASGRLSRGVARDQMTLTVADARALEAQGRYVQAAVPEINTRMQIKFKNRNLNVTLIGTTPNYDDVRGFDIGLGRMFSSSDDQGRRRVVVVGADIPTELGVAPMELLGGTLLIRALPFEVIGIFQPKGAVGFGSPDNDIWIPLNTAQLRVTGTDRLQSISVQVASGVSLEKAMVDIERVIRKEHRLLPGRDNDFTIYDSKQFLNTRQEATEIFTYLLAGIAGVSLLVGGIGIMNIMLVTVTERTREIGVRMALGGQSTVPVCRLADPGVAHGGRSGVCIQRRRRSVFWYLAGAPRGAHGSHRSTALRIVQNWRIFGGDSPVSVPQLPRACGAPPFRPPAPCRAGRLSLFSQSEPLAQRHDRGQAVFGNIDQAQLLAGGVVAPADAPGLVVAQPSRNGGPVCLDSPLCTVRAAAAAGHPDRSRHP